MHKIVVDVTTIDCINFMQQTQSWQRKPEHRRRFIDAMRMPQHHMQALYVCLACFCFFLFVSFRFVRREVAYCWMLRARLNMYCMYSELAVVSGLSHARSGAVYVPLPSPI